MVVDKGKEPGARFLLLYGTATGQAKAIAEEIAEKSSSFGLSAALFELDDIGKKFNVEKEKCVVIVTSTTGDGDPPPNAEKFMRRIKKRVLSSTYLSHFHYALLGLGDSNYSNFNRCARDMDARLEALGANKFYPAGFADDGVGLEVVAEPWLKGLYPALQNFLGVKVTVEDPTCETVVSKTHASGAADTVRDNLDKLSLASNGDSATKQTHTESQKVQSSTGASPICDTEHSKTESGAENAKSVPSISGKCPSPTQLSAPKLSVPESSKTSSPQTLPSGARPSLSENKEKVQRSVNGHFWPETKCELAADSSLSELVEKTPLTISCPPLSEKDLTVPVLPPPYLEASFRDIVVELTDLAYQNNCKLPSAASNPVNVTISGAEVLTAPDAVKKTLLLHLSLEGTGITYYPGDAISIICPNNSSEVDLLIQRLQWEQLADQAVTLTVKPDTKKRRAAVPPHIYPEGSTLRHILTTCLSIRDVPSKALIRAMIEHTTSEGEVRRLQELCSKEGAQDYLQFLRQEHVTLLDFLLAFPSCMPSPETLLEHLPRLQPRPYSACSCQGTHPTGMDIVFNIVETKACVKTGHHYSRRGVCTGWLDDITSHLQTGQRVDTGPLQIPVFVRTNQHFRPPADITKPLIMIGPGTGVSPFIGFLESRRISNKDTDIPSEKGDGSGTYGETWLYFGCRNQNKDFLFRENLESFKEDGTLTELKVTFSRDSDNSGCDGGQQATAHSANKMGASGDGSASLSAGPMGRAGPRPRYVQEQMRQDATSLARLLVEEDALVYICGDAKHMAADVSTAFEDVLQSERGMSKDDAHMFVMKKRIHKTYLEDVWV